jgi:hypothetical protein
MHRRASSDGASRTGCWASPSRTASCGPRTGELRETAIAFLGISDWKFVGPISSATRSSSTIASPSCATASRGPTQAIATFEVEVVNQDERVVQRRPQGVAGVKEPLTPSRPSGMRPQPGPPDMATATAAAPSGDAQGGVPISIGASRRCSARTRTTRFAR